MTPQTFQTEYEIHVDGLEMCPVDYWVLTWHVCDVLLTFVMYFPQDGAVHASLEPAEILYLTIAYDWFLFG